MSKFKICSKCKEEKELSEFYFRKDSNSYRNKCKLCIININQNFKYNIVPWRKHFYSARRRCQNKNDNRYYDYGGRGILFLITMKEIEYLWNFYKAELMDQPSIDRKDNDGNYVFDNCQFIEMAKNSVYNKRLRNGQHVLQLTTYNEPIAQFQSIKEAGRKTNIPSSNISNVVNGHRKTAGGYKWSCINV